MILYLFKISIVLLSFSISTSQAEIFNSSTHNWNSSSKIEHPEQIKKIGNIYNDDSKWLDSVAKWRGGNKGNSVNISNYIPIDQPLTKFKKNLSEEGGSVHSDNWLIFAGKPFNLNFLPRHNTGNMKCRVDVDFGDDSKILKTTYREQKHFGFHGRASITHVYQNPGVYTITFDDDWLPFACNKYNFTLQVQVLDQASYLNKQKKDLRLTEELVKNQKIEIDKKQENITTINIKIDKKQQNISPINIWFKIFFILALASTLLLFTNRSSSTKSTGNFHRETSNSKKSDKSAARGFDSSAKEQEQEKEKEQERIRREEEKKRKVQILAAAALALRLQPPIITAPSGFRVVDMKLASKFFVEWTIYYVEESNPNRRRYFKASIGSSGINTGGVVFKFKWASPI